MSKQAVVFDIPLPYTGHVLTDADLVISLKRDNGVLLDELESMNVQQKMLENALAAAMVENMVLKEENTRLKAFLED